MRHLRIIEKPTLVKRRGHYYTYLVLDDGCTYSLSEVAEMIGITTSGLDSRIRVKGWRYEHVLNPPARRGMRISGGPTTGNKIEQSGTSEWRAMSAKPRTHNLRKIKPLGTFEKLYEQGMPWTINDSTRL
jgi:hypothetical protein